MWVRVSGVAGVVSAGLLEVESGFVASGFVESGFAVSDLGSAELVGVVAEPVEG